MRPDEEGQRPRLVRLLTILLFMQVPLVIFLGLNLLTEHWTFLVSISVFWEDLQEAFRLMLATPGKIVGDEILFFNLLGFFMLLWGSGAALFAGLTFHRGRPMAWIMSLFAQIATLLTGCGLYFVHQPSQSYWLIAIGILMVLYLNFSDVRQWFLKSWGEEVEGGA
jgi:hypothetical protein